jgi:hypothetical protein
MFWPYNVSWFQPESKNHKSLFEILTNSLVMKGKLIHFNKGVLPFRNIRTKTKISILKSYKSEP